MSRRQIKRDRAERVCKILKLMMPNDAAQTFLDGTCDGIRPLRLQETRAVAEGCSCCLFRLNWLGEYEGPIRIWIDVVLLENLLLAAKTALARVLGGLEVPTGGVVQYNGVDLRYIDAAAINQCRLV